jgi:hypothetical protein
MVCAEKWPAAAAMKMNANNMRPVKTVYFIIVDFFLEAKLLTFGI